MRATWGRQAGACTSRNLPACHRISGEYTEIVVVRKIVVDAVAWVKRSATRGTICIDLENIALLPGLHPGYS